VGWLCHSKGQGCRHCQGRGRVTCLTSCWVGRSSQKGPRLPSKQGVAPQPLLRQRPGALARSHPAPSSTAPSSKATTSAAFAGSGGGGAAAAVIQAASSTALAAVACVAPTPDSTISALGHTAAAAAAASTAVVCSCLGCAPPKLTLRCPCCCCCSCCCCRESRFTSALRCPCSCRCAAHITAFVTAACAGLPSPPALRSWCGPRCCGSHPLLLLLLLLLRGWCCRGALGCRPCVLLDLAASTTAAARASTHGSFTRTLRLRSPAPFATVIITPGRSSLVPKLLLP